MPLTGPVFVTMDCDDPEPLAAFWAALLGGEVRFRTPNAIGVRTEGLWVAAMRVDDHRPPTWPGGDVPKQLHLDISVDDLDAAVAEAVQLGAREADVQPARERHRVMLDPAGHPFCLTTGVPREVL
jgi:catechol 2,3-dioxygenase-like lactoylglutathione lyase family enzyme